MTTLETLTQRSVAVDDRTEISRGAAKDL